MPNASSEQPVSKQPQIKTKKGILTDVDVTKSSQSLAELSNLLLIGLNLVTLLILGATLFLSVETQVLKENDLTTRGLVDSLLNLLANAVLSEDNATTQELLQLRNDGLQTVLGVGLAVRTTEVGHEDNGLGAIVDSVLDGGKGTDDTLVVGDVLVCVEGDVEVNLRSQ